MIGLCDTPSCTSTQFCEKHFTADRTVVRLCLNCCHRALLAQKLKRGTERPSDASDAQESR